MSTPDLFDCANLSAFIASIVKILPYEGSSGSHFYLCEIDSLQFLTKMAFYTKTAADLYGAPTGAMHGVDAEIGVLRELKKAIIDTGVSPCIIELVHWKVCSKLERISGGERVAHPRTDVERLFSDIYHHRDLAKAGLAYNKCAFLVLDRCDMTLGQYLARGLTTSVSQSVFKSILCQIVYTLWAIWVRFPLFRHGDFHIDNVMLKIDTAFVFDVSRPKYIRLGPFTVPYFGIMAKIIDFGHSVLPEKNIISDAVNDRVYAFHHTDSDILLLFHWMEAALVRYNSDPQGIIAGMLDALDPERLHINYDAGYIRKHPKLVPTYPDMIKSALWDEYRVDIPAAQVIATYG